MASNLNKDAEWAEANKSEQWKAPVSVSIQEMYHERQEKVLKKKARKEKASE